MKLGSAIVERRRFVLVVVALLGLVAALGLPRLRADFTVDELFADAGELRRITAESRLHFGNTDNALLVVIEPTAEWLAVLPRIAALTEAIGAVPTVARVTSLTSVPLIASGGVLAPVAADDDVDAAAAEARLKAALATPLVVGRLLSADAKVTVVVVQLARSVARADQLREAVARISELAELGWPDALGRISIGGLPFIRVEVVKAMNRDQARLLPIGFAICLLVLFIAFRWWPALVLPLVAVAVSALLWAGVMAWTGTTMDVVTNIVPLLIVIIGISDSIHLVARHFEERARGGTQAESASVATDRVLVACLLTSLTTAIGFASLMSSGIGVLRTFGAAAAVGVMIAFALTVTFLPAALAGFAAPQRGPGLIGRISLAPLTRALVRRRWLAVIAVAALAAVSSLTLSKLQVDEGVRRQFDGESGPGRTMTILEDHLDGLRPLDLLLSSERPERFAAPAVAIALEKIDRWAEEQPETLAARSLADVISEVRFAMAGGSGDRRESLANGEWNDALTPGIAAASAPDLITSDYRHTRIAIAMTDAGSKATLAFAKRLHKVARAELAPFPDIAIEVGGEGYASSLGLESLIRDLARSLAIAIIGIFVVLAVAFGSVRWALVGLVPSGLPIVFGLAYMTARGIPLGTATVIVFSVALGLAVDGTIHVLTRLREEFASGHHDRDEALVRAVDGSGRAILATCLTLIVGFGVLSLSTFVPVRHFGELIAISIVGSLVCQLLLLPPLLSIVGGGVD